MPDSVETRARELARWFVNHIVGKQGYPEGDDGTCLQCIKFADTALRTERRLALEEAADWCDAEMSSALNRGRDTHREGQALAYELASDWLRARAKGDA